MVGSLKYDELERIWKEAFGGLMPGVTEENQGNLQ
jgi:hypothetical protein